MGEDGECHGGLELDGMEKWEGDKRRIRWCERKISG